MHDEADFLRALLDNPADDIARLVYADWLDEQGSPACATRAEFLRLECRMALAPEQSLNRVRWQNQLRQIAVNLDPDWLVAVSHPRLEACRLRFRFQCPARWDKLTPTAAPKVRFCESCRRSVHYCDTIDDARQHATAGECVAVSPALVRWVGDLVPPPRWRFAPLRRVGQVHQLTPELVARLPIAGQLELPAPAGRPVPHPTPGPAATRDRPEELEVRRPRKKWKRSGRIPRAFREPDPIEERSGGV
jgi:uncharacterized protein (TIGR02996 family)